MQGHVLESGQVTAWPEETQVSYNDIKSKIAGEVVKEPARVAAHVGATLRESLAG